MPCYRSIGQQYHFNSILRGNMGTLKILNTIALKYTYIYIQHAYMHTHTYKGQGNKSYNIKNA